MPQSTFKMAKVHPIDAAIPKPAVTINIESLPEARAPLDSETAGSGINSDFEQSFLHDEDTSLNESVHLKDTVLLLTPTVMQPVPRKIAAAILISQRVKLQHTRKKLVELAKSNRKIMGGSSKRMASMRFNMSSRTMNTNKIVDLTITEETQLFPTAFPVFTNDIFARYESAHIKRMNRSRCKLSLIVLLCAVMLALECMYAINQFSAARSLAKQPPVSFHFLGWQLLWNTQPYDAFFEINFPIYWALPVLTFSIISAVHLSFRTFRCITRHRDVGYGLCSRRTKIDATFKLTRMIALGTVIVAWYNGRGVTPPQVKDAFYEAQCALEPLYGRQTEDRHIEGTSPGDCDLLITTSVMENERDYPGLIPDGTHGNEGGNATAFLVPLGKEIGCPLSSGIFDVPTDPSGTHAAWEPFQYRPKRRCLSQKGYTMSNWITYANDCSSDAYVQWINSTGVTSFAHLEQWFCRGATTDSIDAASVRFDTVGWVTVVAGGTCLSPSETAVANSSVILQALHNTGGVDSLVSVSTSWPAALPDTLLGNAVASTRTPPRCTSISITCWPQGEVSLRSISFHDCAETIQRPERTVSYQKRLGDNLQQWTENSQVAMYVSIADVAADFVESVLLYALL